MKNTITEIKNILGGIKSQSEAEDQIGDLEDQNSNKKIQKTKK